LGGRHRPIGRDPATSGEARSGAICVGSGSRPVGRRRVGTGSYGFGCGACSGGGGDAPSVTAGREGVRPWDLQRRRRRRPLSRPSVEHVVVFFYCKIFLESYQRWKHMAWCTHKCTRRFGTVVSSSFLLPDH
jgi:hypothetical protein